MKKSGEFFRSIDDSLLQIGSNKLSTYSNRSDDIINSIQYKSQQLLQEIASLRIQCSVRRWIAKKNVNLRRIYKDWINQYMKYLTLLLLDDVIIEQSIYISTSECITHNNIVEYNELLKLSVSGIVDDIIFDILPNEIRMIVTSSINEMSAAIIHKNKIKSNPLISCILRICDETVDLLSNQTVKLAIKEITNEYLENIHIDMIINYLLKDIILNDLNNFIIECINECELEEAMNKIIDEELKSHFNDVALNIISDIQIDVTIAQNRQDMKNIGEIMKNILCKRILFGHLLMNIDDSFNRTLIQYYAKSISKRLISGRLVNLVTNLEQNMESIHTSVVASKLINSILSTTLQNELVDSYVMSVSENIYDDFKNIENDYQTFKLSSL
jgi:hypothetical protein